MLTGIKITPVVLAAVISVGAPAFASESSDARVSIAMAYKQMDAATARKDTRTMLSFMAPGYELVVGGRTLLKSRVIRNINDFFSTAKTLGTQTSIEKFALTRGQAVVVAHEIGYATAVGARSRKLKTLRSDSLFQDVWVKQRERWLKQKTTNLKFQMTVDGKVIKPNLAK